ncbi:MAG TPA: CPBP family intramembrane glutamic endopeptidase [Actinomycetes bacterium]|nr:CPBP family intramembrane glutamic endopeptidase [Actinomycetes bacterium]
MLVVVLAVLVAANLLTNLLAQRWYVPVCVVSAGVLVALGLRSGLTRADLGLGKGTIGKGLLWAAVLVVLVIAGYVVAASIPHLGAAFSDRRAMTSTGRQIAARVLVAIPLGTVLLEETAFRGVLLAELRRDVGTGWAVALSSVVFGLWHVLPARTMHAEHEAFGSLAGGGRRGRAVAVAGTVAFTAAAGVLFAGLRLWSDSLLPPVGLHWAVNGMGVAIAWRKGARSARRPAGSERDAASR